MIDSPKWFFNVILLLCLLIVTLFSHVVYPGYDVFIGDHKVYIPGILKALDPNLFNSDPLLSFSRFSHGSFSFFDELIVFLVKATGTDLFLIFICISLVLRLIFYSTIYKLSMYLTKDRIISLILVLFFCVAQIKFASFVTYILARSFGIVFGLLSLTLYFGQKRISSSIMLSICLLFHPIFFLQFAAFFYLAMLTDIKYKLIDFRYILIGLFPVIAFVIHMFTSAPSDLGIFSQMSDQYYMFFRERTPDVFLLSAAGIKVVYVYLFNYMLFGFALHKLADKIEAHHFRYMVLILIATLTLLIVTVVGVDIFKSVFVLRVQTMRAYQLLKIMSATLFVYCTYIQVITQPSDLTINSLLIGTTAAIIISPNLALLLLSLTFAILLLRRWSPVFYNPPYSYWVLIGSTACILAFTFSFFISGDTYTTIKTTCVLLFMILAAISIRIFELPLFIKPALCIVFASIFVLALANANEFSLQPKYYKDKRFMEVCNWIRANTKVDAVFLTEPFTSKGEEIRITCGRSIFATFKNAAPGAFSEKMAMAWTERYSFVKQFMKKITRYDPSHTPSFFNKGSEPVIPMMRKWYQKKEIGTKNDIKKILSSSPETGLFIQNVMQRYKVDYILSETPLLLNFPIVFKNNEYRIYELS